MATKGRAGGQCGKSRQCGSRGLRAAGVEDDVLPQVGVTVDHGISHDYGAGPPGADGDPGTDIGGGMNDGGEGVVEGPQFLDEELAK